MKLNFKAAQKTSPMGADEPADDQAAFDSIRPTSTFSESMSAAWKLSSMDTPTMGLLQHSEISDAEEQDTNLINPRELNDQFPDLATPFQEPKSLRVAQIIADRQRERQALAQTIADGPQGLGTGVARFGAMMVPHMIDPVNVSATVAVSALTAGLGLVAEGGEAAVAARAAMAAAEAQGLRGVEATAAAARALRAANAGMDVASSYSAVVGVESAGAAGGVAKVFANPYAMQFAEGVAGNAAGEMITARAAVQEGRPYSAEDAFLNTVGGALFIPGVHWGAEKAASGLRFTGKFALNRAAEYLGRIDPKYTEMLQATAVGRLIKDKLPKPGLFMEQAARELEGKMPEFANLPGYKFDPIGPGAINGERRFFAATYDKGDVAKAAFQSVDHYLGDAVYLSDDPRVMNGAAARGFKEGEGRVIEMRPSDDVNLLNLDKPAPEDVAKFLNEEHGISKADLEKRPLGEIIGEFHDKIQSNELPPQFQETLNQSLKERGYDGFHSDGSSIEGRPRDPHNSVAIFNKEKLEPVAEHAPEPDAVGEVRAADLEAAAKESQSELSQAVHDDVEGQAQKIENVLKEKPKPVDQRVLDADEQAVHDELSALEKQDLLDEKDKATIKELRDAQTEADTIVESLKNAASCIGLD